MTNRINGLGNAFNKNNFSTNQRIHDSKIKNETVPKNNAIEDYISHQGIRTSDSVDMNFFGINSPVNPSEIIDISGNKVAEILGKDNLGRSVIKSGENWSTLFIEE